MNVEDAKIYATKMTYREAINNVLRGKCIPFRKATSIKLHNLLTIISTMEKEKIGYWIKNAEEGQNIDPPYICSECGHAENTQTNFCSQCGLKMEGDNQSE